LLVQEEADPFSRQLGELRRGALVLVTDTQSWPQGNSLPLLRLQIAANDDGSPTGWLSPLGPNNEKLIDARDHLEFEKLLKQSGVLQLEDLHDDVQEQVLNSPSPTGEQMTTPVHDTPDPWFAKDATTNGFGVSPLDLKSNDFEYTVQGNSQPSTAAPSPTLAKDVLLQAYRNGDRGEVDKLLHELEGRDFPQHLHRDNEIPRPGPDGKPPNGLARPWTNGSSGYGKLQELDQSDDRQFGDNLENENCGGLCSCRDLPMFCGTRKAVGSPSGHPKSNGIGAPRYAHEVRANGGFFN